VQPTTTSDENEGTTASFRHALELYRNLVNQSKLVKPIELLELGYPVTDDNDDPVRIFVGHVSQISDSMGLSRHQLNAALSILNPMNCLTRIKYPGHGAPGILILNYEPTSAQYIEFRQTNLKTIRRTLPSKADMILTQLSDMLSETRELRTQLAQLTLRVSELESRDIGHNIRSGSQVSDM
jgi:hypothetical protein